MWHSFTFTCSIQLKLFFLQIVFVIYLFLPAGPFNINGVPLRRVNQKYVIATSTKVDISGVSLEKFDDKYFAKQVEKKKKKGEGEFFEAEKEVSLSDLASCDVLAFPYTMTNFLFFIFYFLFHPFLKLQEKSGLPQEKKDDQKAVDAQLVKAIEGVPELKSYLAARFSLKSNMKPHELVF